MNRIKIIQGDITKIEVDAIVNAANTSLLGGGGVDGAIHRAGGPEILETCIHIRNTQGGCKTGEVVITTAGKLKAKYVIHAVGPVWVDGTKNEDKLLANAYRHSLLKAAEYDCRTVAFPNISTGIYKFPKDRAADIAVREVKNFIEANSSIEEIIFCCFDQENYDIYTRLI